MSEEYKTCLVVDDSNVVRKVARRITEDLGFNCLEAEDGQKALQVCEEQMPDVIILDWNMPVMNGLEFLKEIRKTENGDGPKIIFCTTENDLENIQKAMEAGADEYIMKPFDSEIIETKFAQVGLLSVD